MAGRKRSASALGKTLPKKARRSLSEEKDCEHSNLKAAIDQLHVSRVPDTMPCREEEYTSIYNFLFSSIEERKGSTLYVSGVPGTGKTATFKEAIRNLYKLQKDQSLDDFDFIEINGMRLSDASQVYSVLHEGLLGKAAKQQQRIAPATALRQLEKLFAVKNLKKKRKPCVVLIDELDILVSKKQNVLYNLFDWPHQPNSFLTVVAIANTMDLPDRAFANKISSRLGLKRVNFAPYRHEQLAEIVKSRLQGLDVFHPSAIEYCARKVAAVSGDARKALDICRKTMETHLKRIQNDGSRDLVDIRSVEATLKEMFASPYISELKKASFHQKLMLAAFTLKFRQLGIADIKFGEVLEHHFLLCRIYNFDAPSWSDLCGVAVSLSCMNLIMLEGGIPEVGNRSRLNVSENDLKIVFKDETPFEKMLFQDSN